MILTMRKRTAGFTLIELMIVVSIAAILAAIAYPSYLNQVQRGRRVDATSTLVTMSQTMERCFSARLDYTHADCPGDGASLNGYYDINVASTPSTFTLTATPRAGNGQEGDDPCQTFTLDQAGLRTALDSDGGVATGTCW